MGQWSHRRRRGGGPATLNTIAYATITAADKADLTYTLPADGSQLEPAAFISVPSTETGFTLLQISPRTIRLTFGGPITGDDELEYNGATPGFQEPDLVQYQ